MAAMAGHLECVLLLIGACQYIDSRDSVYMTPLHHAVIGGYFEVVHALLAAGADTGARDLVRRSWDCIFWSQKQFRRPRLSCSSLCRQGTTLRCNMLSRTGAGAT